MKVSGKFFAVMAVVLFVGTQPVHANNNLSKDMNNTGQDIKTDTKKTGRAAKRKVRHATGNHSVIEDGKDKVNDASDDVKGEAKKNH